MKTVYIKNQKNINLSIVVKENQKLEQDFLFVIKNPNKEVDINIRILVMQKASINMNAILQINRGAYNTNSNLKIKCLLTSNTSSAKIVPSLEIMEDKVKAGHSLTIASFDKSHIEYMCSRGLNKKEAKNLIIKSFINDKSSHL